MDLDRPECLFHVWMILYDRSLFEDQLQQLQRQECDSDDISFFKGAHCLSFREEAQTQSFANLQH